MIRKIASLLVKLALFFLLLANMGCALAAGAAVASGAGSLLSSLAAGKAYDSDTGGGIVVQDQQETKSMMERMRAERKRQWEEFEAASATHGPPAP